MAVPVHNVTLVNETDLVRMRITFGYAHIGGYRVHLWDVGYHNATFIAQGHNADAIPDEFTVPVKASDLHGRTFVVDLAISDATPGDPAPGDQYSATIELFQLATPTSTQAPLTGSPVVDTGPRTRPVQYPLPVFIKVV